MSEPEITINDTSMNISLDVETSDNVINTAVSGDPYYADLAKEWAIKTEGKVLSEDYSAKYYALQAKELVNGGKVELEETEKQAIFNILYQQDETIANLQIQVQDLTNEFETHTSEIQETVTEAINTTSSEQLTNITNTADTYISEMTDIRTDTEIFKTEAQESVSSALTSASNSQDSAELAQAWAVSEVIVDNTDYSAKYYAEKAKENSSGTFDYNELTNKPQINGIELVGNKSTDELGIVTDAYTKAETDNLLNKKQDVLTPVLPLSISTYVKSTLKGFSYTNDGSGIYSASQFGVSFNMQTWYFRMSKYLDSDTLDWTTEDPNSDSAYPAYIDIPYTLGQVVKIPLYTQYSQTSNTAVFGHLDKENNFYPILPLCDDVIINGYSQYQTRTADYIYFARALSDYNRYDYSLTSTVDNSYNTALRASGWYCYFQLYKDENTNYIYFNSVGPINSNAYYQTGVLSDSVPLELMNKINVCRILPYFNSSTHKGYTADAPYNIENFGLYSVNTNLADLSSAKEETILASPNEFVLGGVSAENYLEIATDNETIQIIDGVLQANIPDISVATVDNVGVVKPDGETITISDDGTLSAVQSGSGTDTTNLVTIDTEQEISATKTLTNDNGALVFNGSGDNYGSLCVYNSDMLFLKAEQNFSWGYNTVIGYLANSQDAFSNRPFESATFTAEQTVITSQKLGVYLPSDGVSDLGIDIYYDGNPVKIIDTFNMHSQPCITGVGDSIKTIPSALEHIYNNIDGQWVSLGTYGSSIYSSTTLGTFTVDLSELLPADNYIYEVFVAGSVEGASTTCAFGIGTSIIATGGTTEFIQTNSTSYAYGRNSAIFPVGTDRTMTISVLGTTPNKLTLNLYAYRRVGTNA